MQCRCLGPRRTAGHLWPCAERRRAEAADRGPSAALCGKTPRGSGGPRAFCGLVRKDPRAGDGMQGHLWPCAERCRAEAADRGPSVALCGKMLGPKRRTAGHLWPCAERCLRRSGGPRAICGERTHRLRKRLDMRCDHVSGGRFPRLRALDLSGLVVRRESCELVNLRERCATRCTQQERPTRTRATKCRGRPRTAHASLRAAGAPAHRRAESSTARPVTRPRRGRPAPAG
jgi:hypothetical protein